jgi:ABC-type Fe3+ transport system permease subunit
MGLWLFLIALPLMVLIVGATTLLREWRRDESLRDATRRMLILVRAHVATLVIASTTATAFGILAIVTLHVITD